MQNFTLLNFTLLVLFCLETNCADFELDFLQSFFAQDEKLTPSQRLKSLGGHWLKNTAYKNAVGITIENWTNHNLEFPELSVAEGSTDRWLKPGLVALHTSDICTMAYGTRGGDAKGTVSYMIEDSWPRTWVNIGWDVTRVGVDLVLNLGPAHLVYADLLKHEANAQSVQDGMRFFKASDKYVLSGSCKKEGENWHLTISILPQNMDFWAWEKYSKVAGKLAKTVTIQKIDFPPSPTKKAQTVIPDPEKKSNKIVDPDLENEPGIFERKDLLIAGRSLDLQGNRTDRELLAKESEDVATLVRFENWSAYKVGAPTLVNLEYGTQSKVLPLVGVLPGRVEKSILKKESGATGISGIIRWPIGETKTVLSIMLSVPYNPTLYSTWAAMGLFKVEDEKAKRTLPDFNAMYYGTPDPDWFVRSKTGRRMEFGNEEFILVMDSDSSSSKPVVRLALLPRKTQHGAPTIQMKLEGKVPLLEEEEMERRQASTPEGDQSVVSALSSAGAQCHCPCLLSRSILHSSNLIYIAGLCLQLRMIFS